MGKKKKYYAIGSFAGIGAMLIPFHQRKGWTVLGNREDRRIHTYRGEDGKNTFEEYFGVPFWDEMPSFSQTPTLLAAQAKCGGFSQLFGTSRKAGTQKPDITRYGHMIIQVMEDIKATRPLVFYSENLPKSLTLITAKHWLKELRDYHVRFYHVSNYHYGNPQKTRQRLMVIGSRNGFRFTPQELFPGATVRDCIEDLDENWGCVPNHTKHSRSAEDGITNLGKSNKWKDIAKYIHKNVPMGKNLPYRAKDGSIKTRIGSNVMYWDKHAHALAGVKGAKFHPHTGYPISIRERCRIQGYPDDFVIQGERLEPDGTWALGRNAYPVRQLNNTIPLQFCEEFARQLTYFLDRGENQELVETIGLKPNPLIEEANAIAEKLRAKGKVA